MKFWRKEFDVINSARFDILQALDGVELPASFIAETVGIRKQIVYYHLKILVENELVEKRETTKKTVDKRSRKKEKPIILFSLTSRGFDALKYFPKTRKARRYL